MRLWENFCTAQIAKFQPKFVNIFSRIMNNEFPMFSFFVSNLNFAIFFCEFLMKFCPDFATNYRKKWRVSLFQSNLRKQIRKLPKILNLVRIIQYYSKLFTRVLSYQQIRNGLRGQGDAVRKFAKGWRWLEKIERWRRHRDPVGEARLEAARTERQEVAFAVG